MSIICRESCRGFIVDDAELGATEGFERCFIIFDGRDEPALQHARGRWKTLKGQGGEKLDDLVGIPIPIHVTGNAADPKYALDTEALAQALAKSKVQDVIDDKVGDDAVKGLLKGLLK